MDPPRGCIGSCHSVKTLLWLLQLLQSKGQSIRCGLCGADIPPPVPLWPHRQYSPLTPLQSPWPHIASSCFKASAVLCQECSFPKELCDKFCSHAIFLMKPAFAFLPKLVSVPTYRLHHANLSLSPIRKIISTLWGQLFKGALLTASPSFQRAQYPGLELTRVQKHTCFPSVVSMAHAVYNICCGLTRERFSRDTFFR